jgi:hypothetical protein
MAEQTRELVATYRDAESARAAITALERHGVDADRIRLVDAPGVGAPVTDAAQREVDHAATSPIARRSLGTAVVLSVVFAAAGAVIGWFASGGDPTAMLLAAAGGFMAGGALGFVYGGYAGLAVSDEWGETFESHGPTTISVEAPSDDVIDLRDALASTHPERVQVS